MKTSTESILYFLTVFRLRNQAPKPIIPITGINAPAGSSGLTTTTACTSGSVLSKLNIRPTHTVFIGLLPERLILRSLLMPKLNSSLNEYRVQMLSSASAVKEIGVVLLKNVTGGAVTPLKKNSSTPLSF